MRRHTMVLSALVLLGSLVVGSRAYVTAQEMDFTGHPLIGTWILMTDDQSLPDVITFSDDGAVTDVESSGAVQLGAWEPTGDSTANLTIVSWSDEGSGTIRAGIEVAADGQSFTASYTFEFVDPASGESTGEYGPGTATATRVAVEAPGTPIGSFEDLFGQFEGSPEATPVADQTDGVIQVWLDEFSIQADQVTLTAGREYTFVVTNAGLGIHEFVIEPAGANDEPLEMAGDEAEIEDIAAGSTAELPWTFDEPGMYQFTCHIPGHFENGMVLEFEVVAP